MKRQVTFDEKDGGVFRIECKSCPLIPALETLGEKPRPCIAGIVTNMQGPVPLDTCKHYSKDSISNGDDKTLWVECGKEQP